MEIGPQELGAILRLPVPFLVAGTVLSARLFFRARQTTGPVIAADRPRAALRKGTLIGLQLLVLALILALGDLRAVDVLPCIAFGITLVALTPGFHDAVCGESGVQRGYHARSFADLEEWRLMGDHLRFRLFGEWTSVPLPASEQPRIRAKLEAVCPERESRFKD